MQEFVKNNKQAEHVVLLEIGGGYDVKGAPLLHARVRVGF